MTGHGARSRVVHWLTPDGVVACNPRDPEATRRAAQGKLAVVEPGSDPTAITCRKCLDAFHRAERE